MGGGCWNVEALGVIKKDHDMEMLNQLFSWCITAIKVYLEIHASGITETRELVGIAIQLLLHGNLLTRAPFEVVSESPALTDEYL